MNTKPILLGYKINYFILCSNLNYLVTYIFSISLSVVLTAALNNAQSSAEHSQQSAQEAAQELASQQSMVGAAKQRCELVEEQLHAAR